MLRFAVNGFGCSAQAKPSSSLPCSTYHLYELFLVEIDNLEARLTVEQESHHGPTATTEAVVTG
jgi:hypothetical protein